MSELDPIVEVAAEVLIIEGPDGTPDRYLYDHSVRVLRYCEAIARLPELAGARIDHVALGAAALFHDAGSVMYADRRDRTARHILTDLTGDDLRDFSTQVAGEKLQELLPPRRIEFTNSIISQCNNRTTDLTEAKILSDAENLDDMGALGVWRQLRRFIIEGRAVNDALTSWQRRIDYNYWEARIKDCFRYETVREIARQRLDAVAAFMEQLRNEHFAVDLGAHNRHPSPTAG